MITDLINDVPTLSEELVIKWNHVSDIIKQNYVINETTIEGNLGYKYRGDLYGLFRELEIDPKFYYIYGLVNGCINSSDYDGKNLRFKYINNDILNRYFNTFSK